MVISVAFHSCFTATIQLRDEGESVSVLSPSSYWMQHPTYSPRDKGLWAVGIIVDDHIPPSLTHQPLLYYTEKRQDRDS
jgi:hypothetical protein